MCSLSLTGNDVLTSTHPIGNSVTSQLLSFLLPPSFSFLVAFFFVFEQFNAVSICSKDVDFAKSSLYFPVFEDIEQ